MKLKKYASEKIQYVGASMGGRILTKKPTPLLACP
jgi:hypothetical protein